MKVIIDRFEGRFAVVETEDQQIINMPKELIPGTAGEGSVLSIIVDEEATSERTGEVSRKLKELFGEQ